ncbi:MAG: PQQ-binding-like beta-propeller repeat protein, partial [Halobacteriales archaeon]
YAQRLRNGVERWSKTVRGEIVGGAVLQGTTMHVATDSGFMYSLDLNSDGWTEWKKEFTGGFIGSPVLVDGVLYGVTLEGEEGRLYAVDPSNGETLGEYIIGNEQVEQDGDDEIEGMDVELTDGPTVTGANAYVVGKEGLRAFGDEEEVPPTASFEVSPSSPDPGVTVTFDASGSSSGSAPIDTYEWRFSSDAEEFSGAGETYEEDFEEERNWTVSVTVTDEDGLSDTATKEMSVGGSASEGTEETVGSANETVSTKPSPEPGFLGGMSDTVFLALGALGAVVSALGFSAYWRMEPEREKLRRRNKNGGLCHDCGASVKPDEDACGVCGSKLSHRDQE